MFQRVWAVMQKEFIQTFRDRRTLLIQLGLPVLQLLILGYAIRTTVEHIPLVVADQSLDRASRAFVEAMVASGYFDVIDYVATEAQAIRAIDEGRAQAGIVILPDFAAQVERNAAQTLLLVDGSDVFTSQTAYSAITAIAQAHSTEVLVTKLRRAGRLMGEEQLLPLDVRVRILYNPNLADLWFLIPGIIAVILQTQSITLTAAAVVREREAGTIEQILVSPILPAELLIGKIAPNVVIALVNMFTILALGVFWFETPFQGDFWLFFGLVFLYILSGLGMGLLVSAISHNQKQSQQTAMMLMLIGLVLGGFMFPRYLMPPVIRAVGNLFPLTYFIPIARGIITKGVGISYLWEQMIVLALYVGVIMFFATRSFRRNLD
ncbi:MAG TPA: ABC transporter permease [Anaerolineae bacterium]|nr:ABC transporter permease [Anaerolineae bacterium]HQI86811.1 ABC transporter permease [Anaerolineae bacterium]